MHINSIIEYLDDLLDVKRFNDYCPNGLQVHGRDEVKKVVAGVTASLDFLKTAQAAGADTVLVHHGYFWKNEDATVTGLKKKRIEFLLQHQMNLIAYHLPLDAHPELGNNAQLAKILDLQIDGNATQQNLVMLGHLPQAKLLAEFSQQIAKKLKRNPMVIGSANKPIKKVAWCTGAAQGYFHQILSEQVDAYITGEISEANFHIANESGVAFISAGHHATERYGVKALAQQLEQQFDIQTSFIDIDNPV
jgi:dinuclear metal center YbgI/SA1388 family protein